VRAAIGVLERRCEKSLASAGENAAETGPGTAQSRVSPWTSPRTKARFYRAHLTRGRVTRPPANSEDPRLPTALKQPASWAVVCTTPIQLPAFKLLKWPGLEVLPTPVSPEWRAYFRALRAWSKHGSPPAGKAPEDPLRPFRDATGKRPRRPISLRVDEVFLELTKELARQHGLRYQVVIRERIEEGLRRAIREGVEDPERCPYP
jgi:hypothetical protein